MKDKILVSQSLFSKKDWIITTPDLYPFFKDKTTSQNKFNTLYEALEFISDEGSNDINIVSHGSKDFLEIGQGYTTLELEREFSNKRTNKFDQFNLNLWSCYGGASNGIRDSLERCLGIKVNAKNGKLGKGESLENIEPTKLNESIKNLPITLHTNAIGFDVIDNGNGTFGLVVYYGTWHSGTQSQSVESALSLYTLATGGDSTNPDDYTVEAYGQGGAINNQTYYFTNPPKNTGNITFTTTDFNTTDTTYLEGGGATGLSDKGFTPGTNLFFATYSSSSLTSYNSTNGTSLESGYLSTYGFQSAFIPTLSPGTYRAYYDGHGSWDSTEPLNAPDITAVYHPVTSISSALITIDGSGDISVGEPPKILVNSVDGDNGASTTDFVTSGRGVVIRGTYDTTASLSTDSLQVDITNTTTSSTTSYTTSGSELSASAGAWTLTLGSELTPANYTVSSKINTASDGSGTEYTNDQTLSIVAGSVQAITKDDGISSIDLKTTDTTVIIDGIYSASTNSSISITVTDSSNNTIVNAQSPTSTSGDVWYYDLTGTTLSLDTYTVTANIVDSAGSFTTSRNFQVIDGPTAPVTTAIADDSGTTGDFITTDTSLTISGTFDATDDASNSDTDGKLQVTVAGLTYTDTGSNDLVVDYSNGTWSFTPSSDFAVGSYSVLAEITDANGNYNSSSQNILVADASDTTAPTAPTIDSIDEDTDTAGDFTTTDTSLTITGTFDASDYAGGFTVSYGGTIFTMGTDTELVASGNNWTLTYPSTASTGSLVATATDAGGNQSSATQVITVDTSTSDVSGTHVGTSSDDTLTGTSDDDTIMGLGGSDHLAGEQGNDHMEGGSGVDELYGGDGNDALLGNAGNDRLAGEGSSDSLHGGDGNDSLFGGLGDDILYGDTDNDSLTGGSGADSLFGGSGSDRFFFTSTNDSGIASSARDIIKDFSSSESDKIDLSGIDANINLEGDQEFTFVGSASFTNLGHQARFSDGILYLTTDGDADAEMAIELSNVSSLSSSDFVL